MAEPIGDADAHVVAELVTRPQRDKRAQRHKATRPAIQSFGVAPDLANTNSAAMRCIRPPGIAGSVAAAKAAVLAGGCISPKTATPRAIGSV